MKKAKLIHIWSTDSPAGQVCNNSHGHNFRDTLFVEVSCNRLYVLQTEISVLEKIIELLTRLLSTLAKERSKFFSSWMLCVLSKYAFKCRHRYLKLVASKMQRNFLKLMITSDCNRTP